MVSGFEDLLTVPANVLFSGPQRCVMRKMQQLAVPLPEQAKQYKHWNVFRKKLRKKTVNRNTSYVKYHVTKLIRCLYGLLYG